ncbi:MAG: HNH endonuclease [Spirosomataceae bacterium]
MDKFVKETRLKTDPKLWCEVCGFSFVEKYGEVGLGYIEAHHTFPISELTEETQTKPEDIALVCSNCHRMLHRQRPWLSMEGLKGLLKRMIFNIVSFL